MSGPEQTLDVELRAAIASRPLPTTNFKNFHVDPSQLFGQGSENWPILGDATDYILTGGIGPKSTGSRARLLPWFKTQELRWMGNELNSSIYGGLWLEAVTGIYRSAVSRADTEMAVAALGWGAMYIRLRLLGECPDNQVISVGFRSGGRNPGVAAAWDQWLLATARGDAHSMSLALLASRRVGAAIGVSPQANTLELCHDSLAAFLQEALASPHIFYGTAQPIHFCVWHASDGSILAQLMYLAAHNGKDGNGNTTPLMSSRWISGGQVDYLPENGGAHIREHLDVASMGLRDGLLTYTGLQGVQVMTLPSGPPTEHLIIGGQIAVATPNTTTFPAAIVLPGLSRPGVVLTPVQKATINLIAARNLLAQLNLSHINASLRSLAYSAMDRNDSSSATDALSSVYRIGVNLGQQSVLDAAIVALGGIPKSKGFLA